jgi:uncharacterized membrane protein YagU involved in acid resistance
MANFNTHFNVAAVTTGLTAATLLSAQHINLSSALGLWFLGTIGGLLPDIDSDNSTSLDTLFNLFAFSAVFIVIHTISAQPLLEISLVELIALPSIVFLLMKYLLRPIFEKITTHRGSCHSLLFLLLIALITTHLVWRLSAQATNQSITIAWLSGGFILMGGLIHLLLDEIYSVDLSNISIKRSFGTALKIAEFKNKTITLLSVICIALLVYTAPPLSNTISTLNNWSTLKVIPDMAKIESFIKK